MAAKILSHESNVIIIITDILCYPVGVGAPSHLHTSPSPSPSPLPPKSKLWGGGREEERLHMYNSS